MSVKLVVRVLDADNRLLAWVPVWAEMRGDRGLHVTGVYSAPVEAVGVPVILSVHWTDMNVQSRVLLTDHPRVEPGMVVPLSWPGPAITVGSDEGPLPAVTVRQAVTIAPPTGDMSQTGQTR